MWARKLRAGLVAAAVALLIASSVAPGRWMVFAARSIEGSSTLGVLVLIGASVVVLGACLVRIRYGPPSSTEGLLLVASLPVLVLAVALIAVRAGVGFGAAPSFVLDHHAAAEVAGVWHRAGAVAAVGTVVALLAGAALLLDWKPRRGAPWRVAFAVAAVGSWAVLLLPADGGDMLDVVRHPIRLAEHWARSGRLSGIRTTFRPPVWAAVVAAALLVLGRARDRRRMVVATSMCAAAVVTAAYPEALLNELAGFFCFTRPPGPASLVASASASHRATMLVGAVASAPVLALGAWLTPPNRAAPRPSSRGVMALVLFEVILAPCVLFTAWDDRAHLAQTADPDEVSREARAALPSVAVPSGLMHWGGDYAWPALAVDSAGVRAAPGEVSWEELATAAGRARLRALVPTLRGRRPNGARVHADRDLPVGRLRELARAARLDGFSVVVDGQSEAYWPGLSIAARETRRVTVWVCPDGDECRGDWLIVRARQDERPASDRDLGEWLGAALARAAGRDEALLVLREGP